MPESTSPDGFDFTQNWFDLATRTIWDRMMPMIDPSTILEVGSFEGASACYLIETLARRHPLELHCVDTWQGGIEHQGTDMAAVEARFQANLRTALRRARCAVELNVHKGPSDLGLAGLLASGKAGYFDFIYIDGSHQAPDVLADAVLGFRLLKPGGVMAFDDYTWREELPGGADPLRCPKPAIDAFVNIHFRQLDILPTPFPHFCVRRL